MKGQRGFLQVQPQPAASLGHSLRQIPQRLLRWHELGQQRRALAALGDSALKDLGLSRADIYNEVERPFWDDPLKK